MEINQIYTYMMQINLNFFIFLEIEDKIMSYLNFILRIFKVVKIN